MNSDPTCFLCYGQVIGMNVSPSTTRAQFHRAMEPQDHLNLGRSFELSVSQCCSIISRCISLISLNILSEDTKQAKLSRVGRCIVQITGFIAIMTMRSLCIHLICCWNMFYTYDSHWSGCIFLKFLDLCEKRYRYLEITWIHRVSVLEQLS